MNKEILTIIKSYLCPLCGCTLTSEGPYSVNLICYNQDFVISQPIIKPAIIRVIKILRNNNIIFAESNHIEAIGGVIRPGANYQNIISLYSAGYKNILKSSKWFHSNEPVTLWPVCKIKNHLNIGEKE